VFDYVAFIQKTHLTQRSKLYYYVSTPNSVQLVKNMEKIKLT